MMRSAHTEEGLLWRGDDDSLGVFTETAQDDPADELASLLDEALLGPGDMCDDASIEALEQLEHSVARKTKSFGPQSTAVQVTRRLVYCMYQHAFNLALRLLETLLFSALTTQPMLVVQLLHADLFQGCSRYVQHCCYGAPS
jgi:hypothetical protein